MPTPTQANTEDIAELRASNQRIVDAVHLLEVTVSQRFGQIETKATASHAEAMEQIRLLGKDVRHLTGIGKWILGVVVIMSAGIGGAIWYAAHLDARVAQVESQQSRADAPKR